jgi:hypothetical protein
MKTKQRSKLARRLETFIAGLLYVTIGTILATQVSAQSKAPVTPKAPAACSTDQAPDAMCTLPLQAGPEAKICFSIKHARCFELKGGHLIQSLNGSTSADANLTIPQIIAVKTAVQNYQSWLDSELSKKPKSVSLCRDIVSIDSKAEHKEFCLSKLPKTDVQAKTKDLFLTLEHPTTVKSK